jgi:predicted RNase H-like HicB family nuclease
MDKTMRFTVLISKSPNNEGYWAMVPALPGCFSAGDTFEAAQENVKEAIALHVHGMLKAGEEVPDDGGFIVAYTDVDLEAKENPDLLFIDEGR